MAKLSEISRISMTEICPHHTQGTMSRPLDGHGGLTLDAGQTRRLIAHLINNEGQRTIEQSLQRLCETADQTKLLTAFLRPEEYLNLLGGLDLPELLADVNVWIKAGCNEIAIHFVDARQYTLAV